MEKWKPDNVPIEVVLKDFGVNLTGTGDNLLGQSPFRAGGKKTSFTVSVSRNTFHDWKLDICGGPVRFIQTLFNIEQEAAEKLLWKKYYYNKEITNIPQVKKSRGRKPKYGTPQDIDKAYRIFLSLCSLTEEDKTYLKSRNISEEDIEKIGFKTFPKRTIRSKLTALFKENNIDPKQIPGFFQYKDDENITFSFYKGIIIPMVSSNGLISGLQIRKKEVDEDTPRYVWLSSSFAKIEDNFVFDGLGPKNPCHVELANGDKDTLFITEGFFKSFAIKMFFNQPSLSIQGVTNWKSILTEIPECKNLYPNLRKIVIALDADFVSNLNVSKAIRDMGEKIKDDFPEMEVYHLRWNPLFKGIDDFIYSDLDKKSNIKLNRWIDFKTAFDEFYPIGKKILKENEEPDELIKAEFSKILKKYIK